MFVRRRDLLWLHLLLLLLLLFFFLLHRKRVVGVLVAPSVLRSRHRIRFLLHRPRIHPELLHRVRQQQAHIQEQHTHCCSPCFVVRSYTRIHTRIHCHSILPCHLCHPCHRSQWFP